MANHKSAQKRNRQRIKRRSTNVGHKGQMRATIRGLKARLVAEPARSAEELKAAITAIDKAAQKGVIRKQTASRMVSRLTRASAAGKSG
jgi:small subunit ribosomal protein S20